MFDKQSNANALSSPVENPGFLTMLQYINAVADILPPNSHKTLLSTDRFIYRRQAANISDAPGSYLFYTYFL